MEPTALLAALTEQGAALAAAARNHLDRPVAPCPGWDVAGVVAHTGTVQRWAAAIVETGERAPTEEPGDVSDIVGWYEEGLAALQATLAASDPDREVWTFAASKDRRARWWFRRMALETAVHRWDVEAATTGAAPVPAELAAAGIDEYFDDMLPRALRNPVPGIEGSLHLHSSDVDGEWLVDLSATPISVERAHAKADTALRGPASELYLWLWNRVPAAAPLEAFGAGGVLDAWTGLHM